MSKQTEILEAILNNFVEIQTTHNFMKQDFCKTRIKVLFKKSLNKNEIIRRILNECVLSNDEIVFLMRIIYKKKESK